MTALGALDWTLLDHAIGVISFASIVLLILLRSDLRRYFATKDEVQHIESLVVEQQALIEQQGNEARERISQFETKQRHGLRNVEQRQASLEAVLEGLKASMSGLRDSVIGVQRGVDMLIKHQIERERP